MNYENLKSYQDVATQAETFTVVVDLKDGKTIVSSSIPKSELEETDKIIVQSIIDKSVVIVWNYKQRRVYYIPADNVLTVGYQF